MRGQSQAHLVKAVDGQFYVVKFSNNPQGRRILINEWIGSAVFKQLGIATPEMSAIYVSEKFLAENPDAHFQLGAHRKSIEIGWHFGSRFPGDPATTVVYDFIPDSLLTETENIAHFRGALAFDRWTGNADSRQAIFFRGGVTESSARSSSSHTLKRSIFAQMIDNGHIFKGYNWCFANSAIQGLYFRPVVYKGVRGLEDFEPWLTRICNFPEDVLARAAKSLPSSWLIGEEATLEGLLTQLMVRRKLVPDLLSQCLSSQIDPFPGW